MTDVDMDEVGDFAEDVALATVPVAARLRGHGVPLAAHLVVPGRGRGSRVAAGERRLREALEYAGFSTVGREAENPFNMVLEARV